MRNLKRVLSLTLASIMLLGMMVIGTSAASDYSDVDYSEDNVEAIEVLQAINVMTGDLDSNGNLAGTFRPGDEVSRAEMARIMAALMDLDYDYYIGANPFTDMVGHWAEGYAAACAANGIIYGRTATTYDPATTVTAVEAASMLMRALGYFRNPAVDQPDGFVISTIRQAGKIDLFKNVDVKTDEPMTRNDVAQLVLNTLQSGMVEPDSSSRVEVTVGDAQVSLGSTNYVYVVGRDRNVALAINKTTATQGNSNTGLEGPILDLGEKLYNGKLKLDDSVGNQDVFGRPARTWEYDGEKIGTYIKTELFRESWSTKVTGRTLYEALTSSTIENYFPVITIDGETAPDVLTEGDNSYFTAGNLIRANTEAVGATDRGVLTELYVDTLNEIYYIAVINTYLAKATQDYNTRDEDVDFRVYGIENVGTSTVKVLVKNTDDDTDGEPFDLILTVENEDINVEDIKDGDICLAHVAEGEIKELIVPEVISDTTINAFKLDSWVNNGTQYDYADTALYDPEVLDQYDNSNMKNLTYNIILDEYGYLIGLELNEDPDQYVFVTGVEANNSNLGNREADMNVIFLDGTMATVRVNLTDSDDTVRTVFPVMGAIVNTWCKYSVDSSNVYTLKAIPTEVGTGKVAQWAQNVKDGMPTANGGGNDGISVNNGSDNSYTIDKGHISLLGNPTDNYNRVYGTDETVYINAKLGVINRAIEIPFNATGANRATTTTTGNGLTHGIGNTLASSTSTNAADSDWNYLNETGDTQTAAIITDVDVVTVGVRNTDTKVYDLHRNLPAEGNIYNETVAENNPGSGNIAYPKSEIYTLYNKDGYVIAAVTLGEEQGTTTKLAYIHTSNLSQEAYLDADGDWHWNRLVIIDGEEVELTEVGSMLRYLGNSTGNGNLQKGDWAEVRFDANGNVRRVTEILNTSKGSYPAISDTNSLRFLINTDPVAGKYITNPNTIEISAKDNRTVLLQADLRTAGSTQANSIEYRNGSLWITNQQLQGVGIAPNVKIIVATSKLGSSDTVGSVGTGNSHNKVSRVYEGRNELQSAINSLDANFSGYLNILVEDQMATVIILDDRYGTSTNQGEYTNPVSGYHVGPMMTVQQVNALLSDPDITNVIIDGSWTPAIGGTVNIPNGKTLTIDGDFNAVNAGVSVTSATNSGAALVVNGLYTMNRTVSSAITYKLTAEALNVFAGAVTVDADVTITGDKDVAASYPGVSLYVRNSGSATLTINSGRTLTVQKGGVAGGGAIYVNGTMRVLGSDTTVTNNIWVYSRTSLYVEGTMTGNLTLNNGYAEVATMSGKVKLQKSGDELLVKTKLGDGVILEIARGAKITFNAGADIGTGNFVDGNGAPLSGTVSSRTTFTAAADAVSSDDDGVKVPAAATNVTDTPSSTVEVSTAAQASGATIVNNGDGTVTVTIDADTVAGKVKAIVEPEGESSYTPSQGALDDTGFGLSGNRGTENDPIYYVCLTIKWKAPEREGEGKESARCQIWDANTGKLLVDTDVNDPNADGYDPDSSATVAVFNPRVGVIRKNADGNWFFDDTNVSETQTITILWTYNDGVVVTQTRTTDFTVQ